MTKLCVDNTSANTYNIDIYCMCVLKKGKCVDMIQKRDIASLTGWAFEGGFRYSIIPLAVATITTSSFEFMQNIEMIGLECISMGFITVTGVARDATRHSITLENKYENENLQSMTKLIVLGVSSLCAATYGAINAGLSNYFADGYEANVAASALYAGIFGGVFGVFLGAFFETAPERRTEWDGLNIESLRERGEYGLETLEKKNEKALAKALKRIKNSKDDVYKLLGAYNEIYTRKFTKLGTPMEMADRANKKELAKELRIKNNELILCALCDAKNAKNRELREIVIE